MAPKPDRADPPSVTVPCEVCLKEIPASEAMNAEAEDYVLYFCGTDCFDNWHKRAEQKIGRAKK